MGFTRSVMIPCQINSRITNSHTLSPATLIHPPSLKYVHTRFGASQRWATNDEAGDQEGTKETTKDKDSIEKPSDEVSGILESSDTSNTLMQRIKNYFSPPNDGLTFRQRLAKLGLAVALSYGWVSNMSYSVTVSLAWYIFSKRVRKYTISRNASDDFHSGLLGTDLPLTLLAFFFHYVPVRFHHNEMGMLAEKLYTSA